VISASGIALASALWCLAALLGLGHISKCLPLSAGAFRLVLGLLLLILAARNLLRSPTPPPPALGGRELAGHFLVTVLVVGANPITLVTVVALLAAFGLGKRQWDVAAAGELAFAVFVGGVLLWVFIAGLFVWLRDRFANEATARVSQLLSFCALALGVAYVLSAVRTFR